MSQLEMMKLWLPDMADQTALMESALERAKLGILELRFPFGYPEDQELEPQYLGLQVEWAIELITKMGTEGQTAHIEQGTHRTFESAGVSRSLMRRVTPKAVFVGGDPE